MASLSGSGNIVMMTLLLLPSVSWRLALPDTCYPSRGTGSLSDLRHHATGQERLFVEDTSPPRLFEDSVWYNYCQQSPPRIAHSEADQGGPVRFFSQRHRSSKPEFRRGHGLHPVSLSICNDLQHFIPRNAG